MVTRVQFDHVIHCELQAFWRDFLDDALSRELFVAELGFPVYRLLERSDLEGGVLRRLEITPKLKLPAAVVKIVGERFSYVEAGEVASGTYRFQLLPPQGIRADRASCGGVMRAEPTTAGWTKRSIELSFEIRMFGIGSMLEAAAAKAGQESYAAHAEALNAWLAGHPARA